MALAFQIAGPCKLQVATDPTAASTFVDLGYSDNDDLLSFDVAESIVELFSNDTGDIPAELVQNGVRGTLTISLSKWDEANFATALHRQRLGASGTTEGSHAVANIGAPMITSAANTRRVMPFKVLTTRTGQKSYVFGHGWIASHRQMDFGNRQKRLALTISVIPDSTGLLYTPSTN